MWALALACLAILLPFGAPAQTDGMPPAVGHILVLRGPVPVPIPDAVMAFDVGTRFWLLQQNDEYVIGLVKGRGLDDNVVAFPRYEGNKSRAWITADGEMLLGFHSRTVPATYYLSTGDKLAVLVETAEDYGVLAGKPNRQTILWVPRNDKHLAFRSNLLSQVVANQAETADGEDAALTNSAIGFIRAYGQTFYFFTTNDQQRLEKLAQAEKQSKAPITQPAATAAVRIAASPATSAPPIKGTPSGLQPPPPKVKEVAIQAPTMTPVVAHADLKQSASPPVKKPSQLPIIIIWSAAILIFLASGAVIWSRRNRHPEKAQMAAPPPLKAAEKPASAPAVAVAGAQEDVVPNREITVPADLSGSLKTMSLGSLAQLLNTEKECGILTVTDEHKKVLGVFVFQKGEIVDARSAEHRGLDAVRHLLSSHEGHFTFRRRDQSSIPRTITESTMSILLEAYRQIDEASGEMAAPATEAPPPPAS